jgi:hypothetical protein
VGIRGTLGLTKLRRIERATSLTVLCAWAMDNTLHTFVTPDHRHGWYDRITTEWGFVPPEDTSHFAPTCRWLFGGDGTPPRDRTEFGRVCHDGIWRAPARTY